MAPRPLWKGAVNFGLVHIPVRMYKATSPKAIRFRELHDKDHAPLQQKRVCSVEGKEVSRDHVVKGYEISRDHFVIVKPEELEALETAEAHTIDIEGFVNLAEVDPVYFETSYYLVPEKGAAKAYALLLAAMEDSGKAAVAQVVMRSRQHLCLVRTAGEALSISTLYYSDEVLDQTDLEGLPKHAAPDKRELDMAKRLIESLSEEFEPERYHDQYREKLLDMLEKKAEGKEFKIAKPARETAKVIDLVGALEASIAASKKSGGGDDDDEESHAKPTKKKTAGKATAAKTTKRRRVA